MPVEVIHKRNQGNYPPQQVVLVHRPSPLGNPFYMATEHQRAKVIMQFEAWLTEVIHSERGPAYAQLQVLKRRYDAGEQLYLVCFCAPKDCHAHIIADYLEGREF